MQLNNYYVLKVYNKIEIEAFSDNSGERLNVGHLHHEINKRNGKGNLSICLSI